MNLWQLGESSLSLAADIGRRGGAEGAQGSFGLRPSSAGKAGPAKPPFQPCSEKLGRKSAPQRRTHAPERAAGRAPRCPGAPAPLLAPALQQWAGLPSTNSAAQLNGLGVAARQRWGAPARSKALLALTAPPPCDLAPWGAVCSAQPAAQAPPGAAAAAANPSHRAACRLDPTDSRALAAHIASMRSRAIAATIRRLAAAGACGGGAGARRQRQRPLCRSAGPVRCIKRIPQPLLARLSCTSTAGRSVAC